MLTQFRPYNLAVQFHQAMSAVPLPGHLKDQMLRASSSIALGSGLDSIGDPSLQRLQRVVFVLIVLA